MTLAFPNFLVSVSNWESQLRDLYYDQVVNGFSVLPNSALDEILCFSLPYLSIFRPGDFLLPPLTITANQTTYVLPNDFVAPIFKTWWPVLPGQFCNDDNWWWPDSRYVSLANQNIESSAYPPSRTGSPWLNYAFFGYNWIGGGGALYGGPNLAGDWQPGVQINVDGSITFLGACPGNWQQVIFSPPSIQNYTPVMTLTPAPTATQQPATTLRYRSALSVQRLTMNEGQTAWLDTNGGNWYWGDPYPLMMTPVPLIGSGAFNYTTDVLSIVMTQGDDRLRLSLLYACYLTLSEYIQTIPADSEAFAFYQVRTQLRRSDIAKLSAKMLEEFNTRTKDRPFGTRG